MMSSSFLNHSISLIDGNKLRKKEPKQKEEKKKEKKGATGADLFACRRGEGWRS